MSLLQPVENYHDVIRVDILARLPGDVGRVLDFGGGVGATSAALRRYGRATHVVVADMVEGQLDEVDRVYRGDLEDDDFLNKVVAEAGPFDTILALDVLEHLRDPWRAVRVLRDGLAPNGVILASIPNVNYHRLVMPLLLRGQYNLADSGILDRTHIRWFAREGAVELMSAPGLMIEDVQSNVVSRPEILVNKLSFGLLHRFVALQYVIRSRRID
jgi:2-polyprenyl-3-methyl-5-hydroxy-6-metoxy-1,4-benzoquinol methylase